MSTRPHFTARVSVAAHLALVVLITAVPFAAIITALANPATSPDTADPFRPLLTQILTRWPTLLGNTAIVCTAAITVALTLGTPIGLLIARLNLPARRLLLLLTLLAACLPIYVAAVFLFTLIPATTFLESALACGFIYGFFHTPLAILITVLLARAVPSDLEESALLDTVPRGVIRYVTLPHMRWGLLGLSLLILVRVATDITITDVLMVRTFAEEVYTQYALHRHAAGPLLTAVPLSLTLCLVMFIWGRRLRHTTPQTAAPRPPRTFDLHRARIPLALALILITSATAAVLLTPLLRRVESPGTFFQNAWTFRYELATSLTYATVAALLITHFSLGLAWSLRNPGLIRRLLLPLFLFTWTLPAPVVGVGLTHLILQILLTLDAIGATTAAANTEHYLGIAAVPFGYIVRFLPVGVLLLYPAVRRIPQDLVDAAHLDGCDWLELQRHVVRPSARSDQFLIALIATILTLSEVGATVILAYPGYDTIAIRAFTLIHFGVYSDLASLSLLMLAVILIPGAALAAVLHRQRRRNL